MADIFWTCLSATVTTTGSVLALILQKALQTRQKEKSMQWNHDNDKSNGSYAFSDNERKKRLVPFTAILTVAFVLQFIFECQSYWKAGPQGDVRLWELIQASLIVISWMYALLLALLSQQYPLPNRWGWIFNVHLCVFYFVNFFASFYVMGRLLLLPENKAVQTVTIAFTRLVLNFDLLFITATVRRGPPAIDNDRRPVQMITTCSLWQYVTFFWTFSIIRLGQLGRQVEDIDIPSLPWRYRSRTLFEKAKKTRAIGIIKRSMIITLPSMLPQAITSFFASILHYAPPFMMNRVLVFMATLESADPTQDKPSMAVAYVTIIGLFVTTILYEWVDARTWYNG
jgi:hypothetical protein